MTDQPAPQPPERPEPSAPSGSAGASSSSGSPAPAPPAGGDAGGAVRAESPAGKKRPALREAPEPLEANDVATVTVGTVIWFALFVVQLPFYGWYSDHGHTWFIWTCLAGGCLGLLGLKYTRGRRDAIARARAAQGGGPDAPVGAA